MTDATKERRLQERELVAAVRSAMGRDSLPQVRDKIRAAVARRDIVQAVNGMLLSGELEERIGEWEARRRARGYRATRGEVRATEATKFLGLKPFAIRRRPRKAAKNRRRTSRRRSSRM